MREWFWEAYLGGRAGNLVDNIRKDKILIARVGRQASPLGVGPQSKVISAEGMGHRSRVGRLPVAEDEAGRYLLAHSIAFHLIKLVPIFVTL